MNLSLSEVDDGIWTVTDFLSVEECLSLIERGESLGFEAAAVKTSGGPQMMPTLRNNDRVEFVDSDLAETFWKRIHALGLPEIDGCRAVGLFEEFKFYRYDPGQRFKRHKDGRVSVASGKESRLSFLMYLNDDYEGGETTFTDHQFTNGERETREVVITPETGMALLFIHERWHEGSPVTQGRKYLLRTDLLYRQFTAEGS